MASVLDELIIELGFKPDFRKLDTATDKAKKQAGDVAKEWKRAAKDMAKGFAVVGAAVAAAGVGIFKLAEHASNAGNEIAKTSKQLGVNAQEYQKLAFAQGRAGISAESLRKGIRDLTVGLNDAATKGTGRVVDGLAALGLAAKDLQGRGLTEQFEVVADRLRLVTDESQRSAIAMQLFGTEAGADLKPLLDEGSAGIRAYATEAERIGIVLDDVALNRAEVFGDQMGDLKQVLGAVARQVGVELIPVFVSIAKSVQEWVIANRGLLSSKISAFVTKFSRIAADLIPVLIKLAQVVIQVAEAIGPLGIVLAAMGPSLFSVGSAIAPLIPQLYRMAAAVAAAVGPWGALAIGIAAGATAVIKFAEARQRTELDKKYGPSHSDRRLRGAPGFLGADGKEDLRTAGIDRVTALSERGDQQGKDARAELARRERDALQAAKQKQEGELAAMREEIGIPAMVTPKGPKGAKKIDTRKADAAFGDKLRTLAKRAGVGQIAIDRALEAAQGRLEGGAIDRVAFDSAVSSLSDAAGVDLSQAPSFVDQLLSEGDTTGGVPDIPIGELTKGVVPQTIITNITNTFTFNNDFDIDGAGDPGSVGSTVAENLRNYFEEQIAASTNSVRVNFAR